MNNIILEAIKAFKKGEGMKEYKDKMTKRQIEELEKKVEAVAYEDLEDLIKEKCSITDQVKLVREISEIRNDREKTKWEIFERVVKIVLALGTLGVTIIFAWLGYKFNCKYMTAIFNAGNSTDIFDNRALNTLARSKDNVMRDLTNGMKGVNLR